MKKAFTMIELIFVIVIIGILAAVAIPKLAATRTDAKASTIAQEVQSAVQEISNYVTAQGGDANSTELTTMSQVLKTLSDNSKGVENDGNGTKGFDVYSENTNVCVHLETNQTALKVSGISNKSKEVISYLEKFIIFFSYP
jgi:prepilin-type N-terminal cleavage/methylation domain-containing protein